ncbi:MAG: 2-succinyl-6-hydroxy-2,4-cyclohexadiene-1-carboxylate synthase [Variovorax sp.]|nr:MAG: 2-succinyl-6-hydroxy-2,4-cyclohexadiene-1-carboxylate synthase [Variovorax sp.]
MASSERMTDFSVAHGPHTLRGSILPNALGEPPRVLALHGGGVQASRRGIRYLLDGLVQGGVPCASFDFCGHGESDGQLEGSSLAHRVAQARTVAEQVAPDRPMSLIASSMGGHIACALIPVLNPPVLVLFCPAAYVAEAEDAPFGPRFQGVLRATRDEDYAASPAFAALDRFEGRLLLVLGGEDAVIPAAVLAQYAQRARRAKSVEVLRLAGAGHKLHEWLPAHPRDHARVLEAALRTLA